jgi:hypothetical protein
MQGEVVFQILIEKGQPYFMVLKNKYETEYGGEL